MCECRCVGELCQGSLVVCICAYESVSVHVRLSVEMRKEERECVRWISTEFIISASNPAVQGSNLTAGKIKKNNFSFRKETAVKQNFFHNLKYPRSILIHVSRHPIWGRMLLDNIPLRLFVLLSFLHVLVGVESVKYNIFNEAPSDINKSLDGVTNPRWKMKRISTKQKNHLVW